MSRALNVKADQQTVTQMCEKHGIAISVIEPLESGGTRVVLRTLQDAEALRARIKDNQMIDGKVTRSGLYIARQPAPFR